MDPGLPGHGERADLRLTAQCQPLLRPESASLAAGDLLGPRVGQLSNAAGVIFLNSGHLKVSVQSGCRPLDWPALDFDDVNRDARPIAWKGRVAAIRGSRKASRRRFRPASEGRRGPYPRRDRRTDPRAGRRDRARDGRLAGLSIDQRLHHAVQGPTPHGAPPGFAGPGRPGRSLTPTTTARGPPDQACGPRRRSRIRNRSQWRTGSASWTPYGGSVAPRRERKCRNEW